MSWIKADCCLDGTDFLEEYAGYRPCGEVTLDEFEKFLKEKEVCLWNYPLTEIDHIIENNMDVVLVRFPEMYGGYEYRFCEIPKEEELDATEKEIEIMTIVYLVYVIYQYEGYGDTEVYGTREKAIDAADQLLFEFQQDGYEINPEYADKDATFSDCIDDDLICIRLSKDNGYVDVTVEKKIVR